MKKDHDEADEGSTSAANGTLSRRKFLRVSITGAAIAGAGGFSACMPAPPVLQVAGTTPKAVALYQNFPNQGRRCAGCRHFLAPNACAIVEGQISPDGWCRFHEPRVV
jgi:hypothetical protein